MKNSIRTSVSFLIVAAALVAPSTVLAQDTRCRPGDLLCADVGVGPIEGHIRIGPADPPPVVVEPPPVVVVQPPVIYQPPPPVVQPPVVYVEQAPPPPPQIVVVQQAPPREPATVQVQVRRERRVVYDLVPDFDIGLRIDVGAMFIDRGTGLGGMNAALRIRPESHVAIDVGTGIWYGERDYNGAERWEMPVQADLLVFFNPEHRFQVYALVGGGMSFGSAAGRDRMYAGGEAGIGAELRLSRFFALNLDFRGFLRQRIGGGPPEYQELRNGLVYTTDTSGGFYGTLGMTFYFVGN